MRRTTFLVILTLITVKAMAQWTSVASGTSINLQAVHFPTNSMGYIVGDYGIVLQSTDTGSTWQTVHLDSAYSFNSVFFTSNTKGYATGGRNLYKTTDAGSTWTEILTDSLNAIREVYFVNDSFGYAGAENSLYKTTNAGNSWTVEVTGTITSSIHFPSDSVGYFIGGPSGDSLYKTLDGGQSYATVTNGFTSILEAVYFLNDSVGYMCGWYGGVLVKTIDGGMNWQFMDSTSSHQCWDVHFIDKNTGYYINNGGGTHVISKTSDGGVTWTNQLVQTSNNLLHEFFFIGTSAAIAVGDSGIIFKTIIGGSVGIQKIQNAEDIEVYPNPSTDQITINLGNQIHGRQSVNIYSLLGQHLETFELDKSKTTHDIKNLPTGIYLIVIRDKNQLYLSKKLIKK